MRVDRYRAVREDDQGMAVGLAPHQVFDSDGGVSARFVLYDDALSDTLLQILGDDAPGQVDAATGRIGHDNSHRPVREILRVRRWGDAGHREKNEQAPRHAKKGSHENSRSMRTLVEFDVGFLER